MLIHNFIRGSLCIDLKRSLWLHALLSTTLGDSNCWWGSINLRFSHPEHLFDLTNNFLSFKKLSTQRNDYCSFFSLNYKNFFQFFLSLFWPLTKIFFSYYFSPSTFHTYNQFFLLNNWPKNLTISWLMFTLHEESWIETWEYQLFC